MEDATVRKKSVAAIYKLRDAKHDEIQASFLGGGGFFCQDAIKVKVVQSHFPGCNRRHR